MLNPTLDVTKPLTAGMSLCVGGAGASTWCNTPLSGGICPTEAPGTPLVSLHHSYSACLLVEHGAVALDSLPYGVHCRCAVPCPA